MSPPRNLRTCFLMAASAVCLLTGSILTSDTAYADDSTCIVCHTDESLLKENLSEGKQKKSALQTGSG